MTDNQKIQKKGEPVAKVIARCGYCSKREADRLILEGRVKVNGININTPLVFITDQSIKIDNKLLNQKEKTKLWLFNKPAGYIVSNNDPQKRKSIYEILPQTLPRVVPVGRLDINTEGLLLLTNDGKLANFIAHPSNGWIRQYRVKVHGFLNDNVNFDKYAKKGVVIDGVKYAPFKITIEKTNNSTNFWLKIAITEGKNREVRNIMEYLDFKIQKLIRISFGPFQLGSMPTGAIKSVNEKALKSILGNKYIF